MQRNIAIPLAPQWRPLSCGAQNAAAAAAMLASSSSSALFHFERANDASCNLSGASATMLASRPAPGAAVSAAPAPHEVVSVAWLPTPPSCTQPQTAPPPASSTSSTAASKTAGTTSKPAATAAAVAPSAVAAAAAKKKPESWLLALLHDGSLRSVCASLPGPSAPSRELLGAVPEAEQPKNSAGTHVFDSAANDVVVFHTPIVQTTAAQSSQPATSSSATSSQHKHSPPGKQQQQAAPIQRGRGHASTSVASVASSSTTTTTASSATAAALPSSRTVGLVTAIFFRGGALQAATLDVPQAPINDARKVTTGECGVKVLAQHSLGKEAAPPEKLFSRIEYASLKHFKVPSSSSSAAAAASCSEDEQLLRLHHGGRHFVLVHLNGRSAFSDGRDRISAVACLEIVRNEPPSGGPSSSSSFSPPVSAILRTQWVVAANGNVGPVVSSNVNVQVQQKMPCFAHVGVVGTASTTSTSSSIISGSSSTVDHHAHLVFAEAGPPAVLRPAVLHLGGAGGAAAAAIRFYASSSTAAPSDFARVTVHPKQSLARLTCLETSPGISLVAMLTDDNVVQICCCVFRKNVISEDSTINSAGNSAMRRTRSGATADDEQHNIDEQKRQTSWSLVPSLAATQELQQNHAPRCWQLPAQHQQGRTQQLQKLQQMQLTLLTAISPFAGDPLFVDDISLILASPNTAPLPSSVSSFPLASSASSSSSAQLSPLLVVSSHAAQLQSFPLMCGTDSGGKPLRTEPRSVTQASLRPPSKQSLVQVRVQEGKAGNAVLVVGSTLLFLRPKRW